LKPGSRRAKAAAILGKGDHVDLEAKPEELVEKAYQLGHEYEKKHGGCAQCTVAALQDALPFVDADEDVFRAASCLDGGATPTGLQNCGSFTGCGMIIGYLCGRTRNGQFHGSSGLAHKLLRKVYQRYVDEYGSVLCKDVRKGAEGDCPEVVGRAARWAAEALLEEFAGEGESGKDKSDPKSQTPCPTASART
jgi:hypothetical protein